MQQVFLDSISRQLLGSRAMEDFLERLEAGADTNLAVPLSARVMVTAAVYAHKPRPMMVCLAGEEAAARFAHNLGEWLGAGTVLSLPLRSDVPWVATEPDAALVGARVEALLALQRGESKVVVTSARALLRLLPAPGQQSFDPLVITAGEELPLSYSELPGLLIQMGYQREEQAGQPATFALRGDTLDIFTATATCPVRLELFGDEVERIRAVLATSGQTIGSLSSLTLYPARELMLSEEAISRMQRAVEVAHDLGSLPPQVAHHLGLLKSGSSFFGVERYLPYLYERLSTVLEYLSRNTLLLLQEPRALFDDAAGYFDALKENAAEQGSSTDGLYLPPAQLDFGKAQRLTMLSLLSSATRLDGRLEVKHPKGQILEDQLAKQAADMINNGFMTFLAHSNRRTRESLRGALSEEQVPFDALDDRVGEPRSPQPPQPKPPQPKPLSRSTAHVVNLDISESLVVPAAKLALLTLGDAFNTQARRRAKRARGGGRLQGGRLQQSTDETSYTFPFKPGDYVVHETHGIALFKKMVRRTVDGVERDYLYLEYAKEDKLFSPVELIDKVSRYVGVEGSAPRLTRLNTADWTRATGKARKAARAMAFDLVDLYARRASATGFAFGPDSSKQRDMEQRFVYVETSDQLKAIADVKADMESTKPMDRLICGDVGFGKTEVALRATFKAVQDGKQVMLLCPTTILAQQHYTTFSERLASFGVRVDVLSRFRTAAQQRRTLEDLAAGAVSVLIGTHRLLSADVNPKDLGLIIIDEEQRFGVQHKEKLVNLREQLDVLTLSATPIPRTMQMALTGVRDMSLINTPPPSRNPIQVVVQEWDEDLVSAAIRRELERGGQVYYVSNRVKNIESAVERVNDATPEARVLVAHGQMDERALETVMESFAAGEADVLVATTIIESGLDNPHTNTLIIEDAERLGLAQLYQLKGRVGRSHDQAYAYFLFPSEHRLTETAVDRLTAISEYQELGSGMRIAMRDLEIRGAGSLLGAEQHGNLAAVGFDLYANMLAEAVRAARHIGKNEDATGSDSPADEATEVRIDIPLHAYFPEEFVPAADERVLWYRRVAVARSLERLDEIATQMEYAYGGLPAAAVNLLDRARAKLLALDAGVTSVGIARGKLNIEGLALEPDEIERFKAQGGTYMVKSLKLLYPIANKELALATLLELLSSLVDPEEEQ
ncbi:MAG: transcription-repair coupling factor [Coriobacteriia bacterium]|nr:transcription-repair coupling factor [Coriobacteriia bacterium]